MWKNQKTKNSKSPLKETYQRRPGQSLDEEIGRLEESSILYVIVPSLFGLVALAGWLYSLAEIPPNPIILTVLFIIVLIYCMFKISRIRRQLRNMIIGRDGEREVAEYLENLTRRGCYVFHDILVEQNNNKFNIDHVVISQYGIFTLETKAYSNPSQEARNATFDGQNIKLGDKPPDSRPYIQALNEAHWLQNKIKYETEGKYYNVIPILVLLRWNIPQEQMKHRDIWVLNQEWIMSSITQQRPILSQDDVLLIVNIIRPLVKAQRKPI